MWPSKSGPQFAIDDETAAHIRLYPKSVTEIMDDKIQPARILQEFPVEKRFIFSSDKAVPGKLYFVKHRCGAQGKSVYVYNQQELMEWWEKSKNPQDFLIQEEIIPAPYQSRKFVLRSHLLLLQRKGRGEDDYDRSLEHFYTIL